MRTALLFTGARLTALRDAVTAFLRAGTVRFATLLAAVLVLAFALLSFVAFRARALPAGERLVAGFKRVDFATVRFRAAAVERRDDVRVESFFTLLATGLLMTTASPLFIYQRNRVKNDGRE